MAYGFARMARLTPLLAAALVAGCGSQAPAGGPTAAQAAAALRGSPAPLAAVHRQASALLAGGAPAFKARLRALRRYPVVVMQWSSWCEGCKADLGYFQRISAQLGRRVAFVGIDVDDSASAARQALRRQPVSFPSYLDHSRAIAYALSPEWSQYTPITYFFRPGGGVPEAYPGPFPSLALLRGEIRTYAGV
jgi:cytochrome c biogenesis protein CcmG, thiol:disulfide interchange protein DsbE